MICLRNFLKYYNLLLVDKKMFNIFLQLIEKKIYLKNFFRFRIYWRIYNDKEYVYILGQELVLLMVKFIGGINYCFYNNYGCFFQYYL